MNRVKLYRMLKPIIFSFLLLLGLGWFVRIPGEIIEDKVVSIECGYMHASVPRGPGISLEHCTLYTERGFNVVASNRAMVYSKGSLVKIQEKINIITWDRFYELLE